MNIRQGVVAAVLLAASVGAVDVIGDLTQTRPDPPNPGSTTEVVYEVILRDDRRPVLPAAQALWAACMGTMQRATSPVDVGVEGHTARVVVSPALGKHARTRLTGCLEDAVLDRMRGDVVAMRTT